MRPVYSNVKKIQKISLKGETGLFIDRFISRHTVDIFNVLNNIPKYNTPMVNENKMCNNYINLNFNNCKNDQNIDVSTIKKNK